jgi:hypothetical protein
MDVLCHIFRAGLDRAGAGLQIHLPPRGGPTGQAERGDTSPESLLFSMSRHHRHDIESAGTGTEWFNNRWRWAGLRASTTEREVWDLYLV